ncbi:universal stress protein [Streptomyces sp. SID3343]|uniref:universal stress protein n=1 Tax=Streptomyces sp. SID3343 TaxID=2690260 RepID=UPI00136C017B|nr:universal stress protein [Streptomyces sp. SID3343]
MHVPAEETTDPRPQHCVPPCVVVGIDADPLLNHGPVLWAAHEAALRGAAVRLVHAWEPAPAHRAHDAPMRDLVDPIARRGRVREPMDTAEQAAHHARFGPTVIRQPSEGPAVAVLLDAANEASLLVLGSRSRHADRRPLGPVTRDCLRCARCPVVTVGAAPVVVSADR